MDLFFYIFHRFYNSFRRFYAPSLQTYREFKKRREESQKNFWKDKIYTLIDKEE